MQSKEQKYLTIFENCDSFIDLGRHVAYYRMLAGLTQLKLSEKLGVSRSYLGRIEAAGMNQRFSFLLHVCYFFILTVFFCPFPLNSFLYFASLLFGTLTTAFLWMPFKAFFPTDLSLADFTVIFFRFLQP